MLDGVNITYVQQLYTDSREWGAKSPSRLPGSLISKRKLELLKGASCPKSYRCIF